MNPIYEIIAIAYFSIGLYYGFSFFTDQTDNKHIENLAVAILDIFLWLPFAIFFKIQEKIFENWKNR